MPRLEFLLDADMPRSAAEVFRERGHGIEDVRDLGKPGMGDAEVIAHAWESRRIVVTRDTDFGEVLRYPRHPGAIILRLAPTTRASQ
jgi:predicted nuclease of predicted toxin-antitoxin system